MANKNVAFFGSGGISMLNRSITDDDQVPVWTIDGLWKMVSSSEVAGGAGVATFATRTQAAATRIARSIQAVQVEGYSSAGDKGAALYRRVSSQPSHSAAFQSRDGAWWELSEAVPTPFMMGAKGNGVTDDTTILQAYFDYALANFSMAAIPAGTWLISAPIAIVEKFGCRIFGLGGRSKCTIMQSADNQPIFTISAPTSSLSHSHTFQGITATWSTVGSSTKTSRNLIKCLGTGDFFNSIVSDIGFSNGHYVISSPSGGMLTWGINCHDWFISSTTGGIVQFRGSAGEPNCRFENIYALTQTAIGPIFDMNAVTAEMHNIEINAANLGPQIIRDQGGGQYNIDLFGIELGTWAANTTLFDITNGTFRARRLYFTANVSAVVYVLKVGGSRNSVGQIDQLEVAPTLTGSGKLFLADLSGSNFTPEGDSPFIRLANVLLRAERVSGNPNVWSSILAPTNMTASAASDGVCLTLWNDPNRTMYPGDADLALPADAALLQIFRTPITADRNILLPSTDTQFGGRQVTFVKLDSSGVGALRIKKDALASPIVILPAGSKGRATLCYNRSETGGPSLGWSLVEYMTWA